jgi:hypothetical protein
MTRRIFGLRRVALLVRRRHVIIRSLYMPLYLISPLRGIYRWASKEDVGKHAQRRGEISERWLKIRQKVRNKGRVTTAEP